MPHYSAHKICHERDYETKIKNDKFIKNKNFTSQTEYLNLKATSNHAKMQSDKTLTLFLTMQQMESFHNETMYEVDKENEQ